MAHIVGWDGACGTAYITGCIWTAEAGWSELGRLPGWRGSQAFAINNFDQAVGVQGLTTAEPRSIACLWDPASGVISLGRGPLNFNESTADDINESSWVVGRGNGAGGFGAFLWKPGAGMAIIPAMVWQNRVAINDYGQVSSSEWRSVDSREAFIWDEDHGFQFIGCEMTQTSFVWSERRGMVDLNRKCDPCHPVRELRDVLYAVAINHAGVIIATPESEFVKAALMIPYIPGDLDEDGDCDLQDLAYLLSNFGRWGVGYAEGDLDCQGDVDMQDLGILLGNFGETLP
ncbi:MAG: hypothetical protein HZB38_09455 [Planctomycetes bacterium]|nr:hypothetical protein [Planctomycetota bacterium]